MKSSLFVGGGELTPLVHLLQTDATNTAAMLVAVELHQLVVVGADTLAEVSKRVAQLMGAKYRILFVRSYMVLTEGRHAREAGFYCFGQHTGITDDTLGFRLFRLHCFLHGNAGITP